MSAFCQISAFTGPEWSKITILIQILNGTENFRFCQIPSLAGPEWSKISFLNQIFKTTQNFWMLSNFFLHRSRVVKSLNFGPNVWRIWKFLDFAKFNPSHVLSLQKCQFWAKFLTWIKISWFCKISSFAGQEWSNSWFQAKFSTRLKISGFCQISPRGGGGALPLWRWCRCKAPKTPYFQCCCHPMTHIFADCLCCHQKTPHFLVKCGLFDRSHPKTPYFLHSAATRSYFLF